MCRTFSISSCTFRVSPHLQASHSFFSSFCSSTRLPPSNTSPPFLADTAPAVEEEEDWPAGCASAGALLSPLLRLLLLTSPPATAGGEPPKTPLMDWTAVEPSAHRTGIGPIRRGSSPPAGCDADATTMPRLPCCPLREREGSVARSDGG
jgi:hypothetical protein